MPVDRTELLHALQARASRRTTRASVDERLVDALAEHVDDNGRLDAQALAHLEKAILGHASKGSRRQHRKRLTRFLAAANETGLIDAALPVEPTLAPRPALLAVSPDQARRQATARAMDQHLDHWLAGARRDDPATVLLALAMRLVARAGCSEKVVTGILARLTYADVSRSGTLSLPIDPADFSPARYVLTPPKACQRLIPRRRRGAKGDDHQTLLFSSLLGEPPTDAESARRRQDEVRRVLSHAFRAFADDFAQQHATDGAASIMSWRRFAHAARLLPLGRGVPPVFVDLLERFPLPAAATGGDGQPMALLHHRDAPSPNERIRRTHRSHDATPAPAQGADLIRRVPGPVVISATELPEDWSRRVRNLLQAFTDGAEGLCATRGTVPKGKHSALRELRDRLLNRADTIVPTASILHVALAWASAKLMDGGVKVSTIKTYFSRLFSHTLLSQEETLDLQYWDDETIDELTARMLAMPRRSVRTDAHFLATWADFLRYAQSIGLLAEAEVAIQQGEAAHRACRTAIVTPGEFDYVWRVLDHRSADPVSMQWAAALTLGFYGGLRASEVLGLTLKDIYSGWGEVWVHIRAGKTPAARRNIPLHLVAPPAVVAQIVRWVERRSKACASLAPQDVALFGPEGEAGGYNRASFITPLLAWLRELLGEGVDFHLLRHSTVSWLLLRIHAARHRGFRESLHHQASWMFSDEALGRVLTLVRGDAPANGQSGAHDWLYLAKFIGHRDLGTLLLHYSHTLGPIHSEVLERAWGGRSKTERA